MAGKKNNHTYLYLWLLISVALIMFVALAFVDDLSLGGFTPKKGTFKDVILAENLPGNEEEEEEVTEPGERKVVAETDTTVKSVLIFGDSMTILIANRLAAYGEKNGYEVASVTWDSSSTVSWSGCDTLENFIKRYHPDFIMVSLGSNELFLKNFDARRPYVEKLIAKIGDIPFVWIGPPSWKEDKGFNKMMRKTLPEGTFFDSNGLVLPRGADNIHPTPKGGVIWTDSIMSWLAYTPHPIKAERPDNGVNTRSHHSHYYKANGGKAAPPKSLESTPSSAQEEPAAEVQQTSAPAQGTNEEPQPKPSQAPAPTEE